MGQIKIALTFITTTMSYSAALANPHAWII